MPGHSLFITGATGFIGRRLLQNIDHERYLKIYCLIRKENDATRLPPLPSNCQLVIGDLNRPLTYAPSLAESQTVIHLAAATGKATQADYYKNNATGTKTLVEQCEQHGLRNFLYLSTIAVTYPDISLYFYAKSKAMGEEQVKESRLNYLILRPTIVLGHGGQIWNTLYKLARLPFLLIPGTGQVRIQPVHIDDLVEHLRTLLISDVFSNQIIELGGNEKVSFETFLRQIYERVHGRSPLSVHIPLRPVLAVLSLIDRYFPDRLPINSGQLSAFRFDSTADPDLSLSSSRKMRPLNQTIIDLLDWEKEDENRRILSKECDAFTYYLIRQGPSDFIRQKYIKAHEANLNLHSANLGIVDRLQMATSIRSSLAVKIADSYSAIFSRSCIIRKKIVLLLAILESSSSTYKHFDLPQGGGRAVLFGRMMLQGVIFAALFIFSSMIFFPLSLIDRLSKERK